MNMILILISVLLGACGQILMKYGVTKPKPLFAAAFAKDVMLLSWPVLLGLVLYALSALTWLLVLRRVDLSYAYPMVSLGYVAVFVASNYLFHEQISTMRWTGLALICIGVVVLAKS